MDEELRYFEGVPYIGERLLTSGEEASVVRWHESSRRKSILAKLGCVGAIIGTVACFATGLYLFNIFAGVFGTIGFLAAGGYLISAVRSAVVLEKLVRTELQNNRVERFGDSETIVEVLPSSGRVLTINHVPTNAASFGVIRDIGTPPMLLGETYGNRRLSEHEKDEIRRLSELTRQRWTIGELITLVWFVPLTVLIALFFSSLRDEEPLWIIPVLTILAAIPSCLVVWRRLDHRSLRRALRRALVEDAYVETRNDERRTIGVLKPDGLLWTLDNAPSPLRIRWRP